MGILNSMTGLSLLEEHWLFLVLPLGKGLLTDGGCRRLCFSLSLGPAFPSSGVLETMGSWCGILGSLGLWSFS